MQRGRIRIRSDSELDDNLLEQCQNYDITPGGLGREDKSIADWSVYLSSSHMASSEFLIIIKNEDSNILKQ